MFRLPSFRGTGLGAAVTDQKQAQLLVDFGALVVTPIASASDKMPDVAKYEPQLYGQLAPELSQLYDDQGKLEQEINLLPLPVSADTEAMVAKRIESLAKRAEAFRVRVIDASRAGVEQKQLRTAILSVTVGVVAVGLGVWIYTRRKRRTVRR